MEGNPYYQYVRFSHQVKVDKVIFTSDKSISTISFYLAVL